MERIVSRENMMAAFSRVTGNKGAAGIDRMTVADLKPFLKEHWPRIEEDLLAGRYQPQPVRGVEIPKGRCGLPHRVFLLAHSRGARARRRGASLGHPNGG